MTRNLIRNVLFGLLLLAFLHYGWRYIQESSFTFEGRTYYVLFDDAMISMRYAYNLVHGLGLVWNAGEYVEGFTNPLWTLYMAFFHLFPVPDNLISLYIQLSGLAFMAVTLFFVRRIVETFTDSLWAMLAAVGFTAFYTPLIWWSLLGMEVSILLLIMAGSFYHVLRRDSKRFSVWIYILLSIATLVRFDMAIPYLIFLGVLVFVEPQHRQQHLAWGLGLLILSLGGQTLARYLYYGSPLPNTYYLKITGFPLTLRVIRGLYALVQLAYFSNWILFLLPFGVFFLRRDWKVTLMVLLFVGQVAYSIYVGGDAWEHKGGANRYISIAMPFFFIGLAWVLDEISKGLAGRLQNRNLAGYLSHLAFAGLFILSFLNINDLIGDWKSIERLFLTRRSVFYAGTDRNIETTLAIRSAVDPGASVAVIGAGTILYFLPDYVGVDILGKADAIVAHGPVRTPMSIQDVRFMVPGYENYMRPGHMKWDYAHSFGDLQPDVITGVWEGTDKEAAPYLENYAYAAIAEGINVYLKKDSPYIHWDRVIVH